MSGPNKQRVAEILSALAEWAAAVERMLAIWDQQLQAVPA